ADESETEIAKGLYSEGKEAYEQMHYQLAFDRFRAAYTLSHQPELLFNMSSAAQGMNHPKDAAELLRAYLRIVPEDPDRPGIARPIKAWDEQPPVPDRTPPPPAPVMLPKLPPPPLPPRPPGPWYKDVAGHLLFITGVAALAAGAGLLAVGNSRVGDLPNQPDY